ncbi:MAG: glycosyltransferase family 2 protein [Chloroflexota bacterium]
MGLLSIIVPVYNEEESLPHLAPRLNALIDTLAMDVEVWLVDDHSTDDTPQLLQALCDEQEAYHYIRLASNSGSHIAILAGLRQARGDCATMLAADLQDPPELIPELLALWQAGNKVVWGVRAAREGISSRELLFANLFYNLLNRFSEVTLPPSGADYTLLDRVVIDALLQSVGANPSIALEIARLGFTSAEIPYVKEERQYGVSKWNLRKKLNAFADAFVTTSYMPLRLMSYIGILFSVVGFVYALVIIVLRFANVIAISGWAGLMVVVLVFGGIQMIMLGVIGEYLWRTLEQSRKRPLYFIEDASDEQASERMIVPSATAVIQGE